jgi:hypothetical protein
VPRVIRQVLRAVLAAGLFGLIAASASAASTYFIRITGAPSAIACDTTSFNFGPGATITWNVMSTASMVDATPYINGVAQGTTASNALFIKFGAAGTQSLQNFTNQSPYTATIPYTLTYVLQPEDPFTDGVSASFTCTATGGTNFHTAVIPPLGPNLAASPASVPFPATAVGTTSATHAITITNNGTANATGVAVANGNSADFALSGNTCTGTLVQGGTCTFNAAFKPSSAGAHTGQVTVSADAGVSVIVALSGTGMAQLSMVPSFDFGNQGIGTTSAPTSVAVTNTGTTAVAVASVTSSNPAEFPVTTTCASVAAGATCAIGISFAPSGAGARSGTITVTSNGAGSPQTISVTGTGTSGALAVPATVTFGAQTVGTTSAVTNLTVTNTGGAPVTVAGIVSSAPAEFAVASPGCTTLNAGATCTIGVTFKPAAAGARTATITVTSNGVGSPQTINASGTGTAAGGPGQLQLPGTVTFGTQAVGTPSAGNQVTLTNIGGTAVTVSSIVSSAPSEFAMTSPSCQTINAGASCVIVVVFTPAAAGARTATITVTSSGVGSPQSFNLNGTGTASVPGQLALPATIAFGDVVVGVTSAPMSVTATNTGDTAVQVSSVASGNPSEFTITQSTCGNVNPGAGCSFSLTFKPGATGARTAAITVVSSGTGSPQTVTASGTGVATAPTTVDLIEYHHAEWDHYFITGIPVEIVKLDNGTFVGWARTGYSFKSYPLNTPGSNVVCRFFSTSFAPKSSHFYTPFADECTIVQANPDWQFEGPVFNIPVPDLAGACPAGTVPVYRLYNNGQGAAPNHRYTTDFGVRAQMIANGWIPEGYGPVGVIMCAPA